MKKTNSITHIKATLAGFKRGLRFIDYRESATLAHELRTMLQEIEENVDDPRLGLELVAALLETDSSVLDNCDDSDGNIGEVYGYDACETFVSYAGRCEEKDWLGILVLDLYKRDEYGIRDWLLNRAAEYLTEPILRKFVDQFWSYADRASEDHRRLHWLLGIEAIARQLKDAPLFEKACLAACPKQSTASCLNIAEVYFDCGYPLIALKWLDRVSEDETFMSGERDELLLKVCLELDLGERATETAWRIFHRFRDESTFSLLLSVIGEENRAQVVAAEAEVILETEKLVYSDVRFLIDMGRIGDAERYLLSRSGQLNGDYYTELKPLAEVFEEAGRFLTACVLYRALLDSILSRARSQYYYHGVSYLHKLDELGPKVGDWGQLQNHEEYKSRLLTVHKRKVSFWGRYNR